MTTHDDAARIRAALPLPTEWQRRFNELVGLRVKAIESAVLAVNIGNEPMRLLANAEIARIDSALARILNMHAKGLLRRWGVATLEGLL